MKAKLRQIACDADELVDLPGHGNPVRLEHDEYGTPLRKTCTLCVLERSQAMRPLGSGPIRGVGTPAAAAPPGGEPGGWLAQFI